MKRWLLKSEPGTYAFDDLVRDGSTVWDGISNALALQNLRTMTKGDELLFYHTGAERRVVGLARVTRAPFPDPKLDDPKRAVVEIAPVGPLTSPVSLDQIKADPAFKGWDLLRLSRLSVVPVPDALWDRLIAMARATAR